MNRTLHDLFLVQVFVLITTAVIIVLAYPTDIGFKIGWTILVVEILISILILIHRSDKQEIANE